MSGRLALRVGEAKDLPYLLSDDDASFIRHLDAARGLGETFRPDDKGSSASLLRGNARLRRRQQRDAAERSRLGIRRLAALLAWRQVRVGRDAKDARAHT